MGLPARPSPRRKQRRGKGALHCLLRGLFLPRSPFRFLGEGVGWGWWGALLAVSSETSNSSFRSPLLEESATWALALLLRMWARGPSGLQRAGGRCSPDSAYAPQRLRRARGPSSVGSSWGPSGGGADATPAFSLRCVGLSSVLGRRPLGAVQGWGVLIYRRRTDVFVDGLLAAARYSCRRCHFVFKTSGVWQELERARNFQNS